MKKNKKQQKFIFVVGGVMSGVGKGITASSIGKILQFSGYNISAVKIDPYVNVDAGTMNPTEHGETFVLEDGYETDQDMGNYERFLNTALTRNSYMTTGSIYQKVIHKERSLGYKGKTVSVVPHVPLAVIEQIKCAAIKESADITIVEIGGTVGEYENILFLEAARMMKRQNPDDAAFVLVSYLPIPNTLGEMKTKPTQQAVRTLQQSGIFPDIIVGRSSGIMDSRRKDKIAISSMLHQSDVISAPNLESIYDVPSFF
jgi:CTP synthase